MSSTDNKDKILDKMLENYKSLAELQDFSKAQHRTIIELTKKLKDLQEKNSQLEAMLKRSSPVLIQPAATVDEFHEETICRMELKKLHDVSLERQLTYEETKKVEIYTKLLISLNTKPKSNERDVSKLSNDDLLTLTVEPIDDSNKQ